MSTFTVGGIKYAAGKLSAFDQFHVARKLGPILLFLGNAGKADPDPKPDAKPLPKRTPEQEARDFAQAICAMSAPLSRDDSEMAMGLCLSTVTREIEGGAGWAPIREPMSGKLMYADIELPELLEIVWHVLKVNKLSDFFAVSPSAAAGA